MIAGKAGAIKTIAETINAHMSNADVCKSGCEALLSITEASIFNQRQACESSCVKTICKILCKRKKNSESIVVRHCKVLGALLSNKRFYAHAKSNQNYK